MVKRVWKQLWLWPITCLLGIMSISSARSAARSCWWWCAGEELTSKSTERLLAITLQSKQNLVEPLLGLLVINTTSPAPSSPHFDHFHNPQGDHDLHFEKHCCSTTKLRGEVHWQYTAVNLGWITSCPGLMAAFCSWCTGANVTHSEQMYMSLN